MVPHGVKKLSILSGLYIFCILLLCFLKLTYVFNDVLKFKIMMYHTSIPGLTIQCGSTSSRPKAAVSLVSGRHATMRPGKVTGILSMVDMAGIG